MAFLSCDEYRTLLADEVSGEAVEREPEMRSHLGACESCAAHSGQILWQDRVLAELAGRARLEPLLARIRGSIVATRPLELSAEPPLRIRARRPRWGRAAVAAAIFVAALGAGFLAFRPNGAGPVERVADLPKTPRPEEVSKDSKPELPAPLPIVEEKKTAPEPEPVPPPVRVASEPKEPKKEAVASNPVPPQPEAPVGPAVTAPARVSPKDAVVRKDDIVFTPRTVDMAVRDGMAYLQNPKRLAALDATKIHHDLRYDELVLWTYLHGGMAEGDPEFQKVLKRVLDGRLLRTYAVALQAMVLEELDRVTHQTRIQQCAQFLVDNQGKNGQWGYGDPSIFAEEVATAGSGKPAPPGVKKFGPSKDALAADGKPKVVRKVIVKKMRQGPDSGDHSNSMYAALGLRACFDAGIVLPQDLVLLAQKSWREAQIKGEGGWCYGRHEGHKSYGSMTAGGVGSLVIYAYILGQDWKRDAFVKSGLEWLDKRFSVDFNPGVYEHGAREENTQQQYFYYMYALERAAILYNTTLIGRNDWYKKGADALLGCQRQDGSWAAKEGGNELSDTCFAILFLRKATRALPDLATGGRPK